VELIAVPAVAPALGSPDPVESATQTISATLIGPAGQVDALSQLAAYWYEADTTQRAKIDPTKKANGTSPNGSTWRPGLFVLAHLKSSQAKPQQAVSIPLTALLIHQGRMLVYVRLSPGRYERREVRLLGREGDRWIVTAGVTAGEPVAYRQAQILLSEEFRGDVDTD
jgi:multidrug efflux pump subunit AcrA (membrane-fusion protein)